MRCTHRGRVRGSPVSGDSSGLFQQPVRRHFDLATPNVRRHSCVTIPAMCCPYFSPLGQRREIGVRCAMLPLGDFWDGTCHARTSANLWQPVEDTALPLCNIGYARGACARFPQGDGPDAVRFVILGDDGSSIRLHYAIERDHYPYAHGALEFSRDTGVFSDAPTNELFAHQAQAYVKSYLRRKD